eukprot:Sdes_comp19686_c0_seq3m11563
MVSINQFILCCSTVNSVQIFANIYQNGIDSLFLSSYTFIESLTFLFIIYQHTLINQYQPKDLPPSNPESTVRKQDLFHGFSKILWFSSSIDRIIFQDILRLLSKVQNRYNLIFPR